MYVQILSTLANDLALPPACNIDRRCIDEKLRISCRYFVVDFSMLTGLVTPGIEIYLLLFTNQVNAIGEDCSSNRYCRIGVEWNGVGEGVLEGARVICSHVISGPTNWITRAIGSLTSCLT
ncbi:hypothetical protein J6590_043118 [Homalodisca vitripennis]|nr:hypothetical protein J6590_043118 [Homalodisca vitripennis]